jgi:glycosyltransferase involved in cell wall biosynthesis
MSKILLVITTYNQSEYTKLCFDSLKQLIDDNFDVLVIDDYSTDDTVKICDEYGYEVITKSEGKGLTHSWNLGYSRFKSDDYSYLIVANNDILIPNGALRELVSVYEKWPYTLVVPLSTTNGAGHNAQNQSVETYYDGINSMCNEPQSYQKTQDTILNIKSDMIQLE